MRPVCLLVFFFSSFSPPAPSIFFFSFEGLRSLVHLEIKVALIVWFIHI